MFQYAALERNNTTEPLGGRKRCRLAPQTDSAPNLNSYSIVTTQLEEMQLPHRAADRSDAAWNYSVCSDAHLESGENLVQKAQKHNQNEVLFISVLGTAHRGAEIKGGRRQQMHFLTLKLFLLFTC